MDNKVALTIDGVHVEVPAGTTVLQAARAAHIHIPTLCFLKDINELGDCRVCVVDTGARTLQAACVLPVTNGMTVRTNTPAVREARRVILELILSNHDMRCLTCIRNQNCELQKLAREIGVTDSGRFEGERTSHKVDDLSPAIVRDNSKCVLCRRCVSACREYQNIGVIGMTGRGFHTSIEPPWGFTLSEMACINCGQCISACPVGALREKSAEDECWQLIADPKKHVVVQTAPAVRAALGEEFGMPIGTSVTGKMAAALRRLGFDRVFDTDFGADVTIMEEATELVKRLQTGGTLPMITSCSPGWIKYCEQYYPEFIPNLSTCKSPHEMEGALIKSYYAEKTGIDPKSIAVVSVMPCTAKKFEATRPELSVGGLPDVDLVLTTRELARMIKESGIDFANLDDEGFDDMMGESTGAAVIFGATGGVMEAALRTAYETITGKPLQKVEFEDVRGVEGVKEAVVTIGDMPLRVAVAHGTKNATTLLESVKSGEKAYQFIEIMGCPGGCVNGGGQPIVPSPLRRDRDIRVLRARALYQEDADMPLRKSHENPAVKRLYARYLGKPCGERSHELLHTGYHARAKYTK